MAIPEVIEEGQGGSPLIMRGTIGVANITWLEEEGGTQRNGTENECIRNAINYYTVPGCSIPTYILSFHVFIKLTAVLHLHYWHFFQLLCQLTLFLIIAGVFCFLPMTLYVSLRFI